MQEEKGIFKYNFSESSAADKMSRHTECYIHIHPGGERFITGNICKVSACFFSGHNDPAEMVFFILPGFFNSKEKIIIRTFQAMAGERIIKVCRKLTVQSNDRRIFSVFPDFSCNFNTGIFFTGKIQDIPVSIFTEGGSQSILFIQSVDTVFVSCRFRCAEYDFYCTVFLQNFLCCKKTVSVMIYIQGNGIGGIDRYSRTVTVQPHDGTGKFPEHFPQGK